MLGSESVVSVRHNKADGGPEAASRVCGVSLVQSLGLQALRHGPCLTDLEALSIQGLIGSSIVAIDGRTVPKRGVIAQDDVDVRAGESRAGVSALSHNTVEAAIAVADFVLVEHFCLIDIWEALTDQAALVVQGRVLLCTSTGCRAVASGVAFGTSDVRNVLRKALRNDHVRGVRVEPWIASVVFVSGAAAHAIRQGFCIARGVCGVAAGRSVSNVRQSSLAEDITSSIAADARERLAVGKRNVLNGEAVDGLVEEAVSLNGCHEADEDSCVEHTLSLY